MPTKLLTHLLAGMLEQTNEARKKKGNYNNYNGNSETFVCYVYEYF